MAERPPHIGDKSAPGRKADLKKRRSRGLLAAAVEVDRLIKPLSAKKGFAEFDLARAWGRIMGEKLAAQCTPQRLVRGPKGRDGTLHLGVWGPLALELQHMTPQLIERINGHYGYRAVAKMVFHQTPPRPTVGAKKRPAADPPTRTPVREPADLSAETSSDDLEARAREIADPDLRAALLELGRSVRRSVRHSPSGAQKSGPGRGPAKLPE
ncbi:MAG: DUF721 domain-containing protein [Alphaproteobacteria bacterium]|nr:DUF721 domain-containing protein [Alphaproteobacteria bacterium]